MGMCCQHNMLLLIQWCVEEFAFAGREMCLPSKEGTLRNTSALLAASASGWCGAAGEQQLPQPSGERDEEWVLFCLTSPLGSPLVHVNLRIFSFSFHFVGNAWETSVQGEKVSQIEMKWKENQSLLAGAYIVVHLGVRMYLPHDLLLVLLHFHYHCRVVLPIMWALKVSR